MSLPLRSSLVDMAPRNGQVAGPTAPRPPARYDHESFGTYEPQNEAQQTALEQTRAFTEQIRQRYSGPRWLQKLRGRKDDGLGGGLYLVGPVGTGKTHLLASLYHALHPAVPCAFVHSSTLFRSSQPPEAYARDIAATYRVLLIDEVELDDVAAEIRLINVLKTLKTLGVTVAATSNAEPEKFVSAQFGRDRLERFISEEFQRTYHVVFVGGEDYRQRLAKAGHAWIGPAAAARAAMSAVYKTDTRTKRWYTFNELLMDATEVERSELTRQLARLGSLYIHGIHIRDTDDALRLLRIIDDLYQEPQPPTLYFTSEVPPNQWFLSSRAHAGIEKGVADKFTRTTSRLAALAKVEYVMPWEGSGADVVASPYEDVE